MDTTRALHRLLTAAVVIFGSVIAIAQVTAPDDAAGRSTRQPAAVASYTHEVLQRAADMTQQMSAPTADTGSTIHARDEQLARSESPGYVQALEQHQADLDQMLARDAP